MITCSIRASIPTKQGFLIHTIESDRSGHPDVEQLLSMYSLLPTLTCSRQNHGTWMICISVRDHLPVRITSVVMISITNLSIIFVLVFCCGFYQLNKHLQTLKRFLGYVRNKFLLAVIQTGHILGNESPLTQIFLGCVCYGHQ